jgi:hypothetical protein
MPRGNDSALDQELMSPRRGDDVLERAQLFPRLFEAGAESNDSDRFCPLAIELLDASGNLPQRELDLLISK